MWGQPERLPEWRINPVDGPPWHILLVLPCWELLGAAGRGLARGGRWYYSLVTLVVAFSAQHRPESGCVQKKNGNTLSRLLVSASTHAIESRSSDKRDALIDRPGLIRCRCAQVKSHSADASVLLVR